METKYHVLSWEAHVMPFWATNLKVGEAINAHSLSLRT